jgi:hypothetical protein
MKRAQELPFNDARHRVDADDVFASYRKRLPPERLCDAV